MGFPSLLRRRRRLPLSEAPGLPLFSSAARTHVGRIRTVNEDRLLDRADRQLWAVADGMGGHSAGAAAAMQVVDALDALADGSAPIDAAAVLRSLNLANRAIYAGERNAHATSGATVVAALIEGTVASILWAGDSRAYRIRGDVAELLTRDHSVVQEMIDAGLLDEAAAERHPQANVVTRALGVAEKVAIDCVTVSLEPGDRLLLCSDGVSRSMNSRDCTTRVEALADTADRLLTNALQRDGSDNATLIVIQRCCDS